MSDNKRQQEIIEILQTLCEELGWVIGIPSEEDSDEAVEGLIIGTEEFVYGIVSAVQKDDDYDVYAKDVASDGMKEITAPKKKVVFH